MLKSRQVDWRNQIWIEIWYYSKNTDILKDHITAPFS